MYRYLLYFLIFSFLGWCAEVIFHAFKSGRFVNRGLGWGPVCPIYGIGISLSAALLQWIDSFVLLALFSMAIATSVELLVGFLSDRFLHCRLWDYSSEKGNILGYVCPRFSLIWGIMCAVVIKLLPLIDHLINSLDTPVFKGVAFVLFVIILMDERISMIKQRKHFKA